MSVKVYIWERKLLVESFMASDFTLKVAFLRKYKFHLYIYVRAWYILIFSNCWSKTICLRGAQSNLGPTNCFLWFSQKYYGTHFSLYYRRNDLMIVKCIAFCNYRWLHVADIEETFTCLAQQNYLHQEFRLKTTNSTHLLPR